MLQRGLAVLRLGHHDVAGMRGLLLLNHHPVAIGDLGVDHRIPHHLEHEVIVTLEEGFEVDPLALLLGRSQRAGRYQACQGQPAEMGRFRHQFDRPRHVFAAGDQSLPLERFEMTDDAVR